MLSKKILTIGSLLLVSLLMFLSGCSLETEQQLNNLGTTIGDHVGNVRDKDNPYVLSVKGGNPLKYPDKQYGEYFEQFFGNPTWTYFLAETGEHVVEFTGFMLYKDTEVKARMQFIVKEDSDQFQAGALEFNGVPQDQLITVAVLSKVFGEESVETVHETEAVLANDSPSETSDVPSDTSKQQNFIFADDDEVGMLDEEKLQYFLSNYPDCFAPGLEDYEIGTCLYWATHPEEHEEYVKYWEEAWAEDSGNQAVNNSGGEQVQHIFAVEDVLRTMDKDRLQYFQTTYPQCFQPDFYEYDRSECLYWATNPDEYEKYMKAWDDYWAENPDGSMADFPGQRWINEEWINYEE